MCCAYNFEYGYSLANFQDKKFHDYLYGKSISKEEEKRLTKNMWVKTAEAMAPSNLVVRHYCLIDLYKGRAYHKRRIRGQLNILGKDIWREGYSYWLYVKPMLSEYHKKFHRYGSFIKNMDKKFQETSYMWKDGKLYPAPFGDIRRIPLEDELQTGVPVLSDRKIGPLFIDFISPNIVIYHIISSSIGLNTHIPLEDHIVVVTPDTIYVNGYDGTITPFKWYEGYDRKYKDMSAQFKDTFHWKRITSLDAMWKLYTLTLRKNLDFKYLK